MRFTNLPSIIILLFFLTSVLPVWGFDGHIVQEGPLKVIMHDVMWFPVGGDGSDECDSQSQ